MHQVAFIMVKTGEKFPSTINFSNFWVLKYHNIAGFLFPGIYSREKRKDYCSSCIWGQKPSWAIRNPTRSDKFFRNRHVYKQLRNTFWVCFFHFWYYQSDILDLKAKFWLYIKKCEIHVFEQIWQVSQILLKNSSISSNMTKPSLEPCRGDPDDAFQ